MGLMQMLLLRQRIVEMLAVRLHLSGNASYASHTQHKGGRSAYARHTTGFPVCLSGLSPFDSFPHTLLKRKSTDLLGVGLSGRLVWKGTKMKIE